MAEEEANIMHEIFGTVRIRGADTEFLQEKEFAVVCGGGQVIRSGSSGGGGGYPSCRSILRASS